jgi:subtilisin family serine protease
VKLRTSREFVVVRTRRRAPLPQAPLSRRSRTVLDAFERYAQFLEPGVEILRLREPAEDERDAARAALKGDREIQFAGRVLVPAEVDEPTWAPHVYTENLFVKLADGVKATEAKALLARYRLRVKRPLRPLGNTWFVAAPADTGLAVFEIAEQLLAEPAVELCQPEIVRERRSRRAFPPQWHLAATRIAGRPIKAHAHVAQAWRLTAGTGATIAIIDDGVDVDHPEFATRGKIVAPRDVTRDTDDPRPGWGNHHGTACAGVATASGRRAASGVAPKARLMPIRLASHLGSINEAEAFVWAADHGADVISCSWGPPDGDWWDPKDSLHTEVAYLPDHTRLAIDYAATRGRRGKGCVVCFAAGNGNESVDNDHYASYARVIAVAACNDTGTRSVYSDYGKAVWCAFPSDDAEDEDLGHPAPLTPGIFTTDRLGYVGYNRGNARLGDAAGDYTNDFGGTSSACPGVAGVAALILSRNPTLSPDEVRAVLGETAEPIDTASGRYDAAGHSPYYGYGRVNAYEAVRRAARRGPRGATPSAATRLRR